MNNIRDNFIKILKDNDTAKLKDFLAENGKQPKLMAAVMFENKGKENNNDSV
ncbi:MAG: hypothetical protein IKR19_08825 [Acholeplasmatales bacterium]|nr:hypothetical protein [Acholeplasmatales bacterium]